MNTQSPEFNNVLCPSVCVFFYDDLYTQGLPPSLRSRDCSALSSPGLRTKAGGAENSCRHQPGRRGGERPEQSRERQEAL